MDNLDDQTKKLLVFWKGTFPVKNISLDTLYANKTEHECTLIFHFEFDTQTLSNSSREGH